MCVCVWVKLCSKEPLACRGTPEAHRAVSNEALYGVFRISGLITLTYLHLWNCWQAVTLRCFPSIFFFDFDPFLFLELFNPERAKFIQLWFCALNHSWPSINVHAVFFPSLKLHGLWQAINGHWDTLVAQTIVETKYPVFVTYQVCFRRCVLSESRRDPPSRGRGTILSVWSVPGNLPLKHFYD